MIHRIVSALLFLLLCTPVLNAHADKVGLAVDSLGVDDFAGNDLLLLGAAKAGRTLGIEFQVAEPMRNETPHQVVQRLLDTGCGVVMAGGGEYQNAVRDKALQHPGVRFVLIDAPEARAGRMAKSAGTMPANVTRIVFRQQEAAYLAGMMAGAVEDSQWVGVLFSEPGWESLELAEAFYRGAKAVNPRLALMVRYVSERGPRAVMGAAQAPGQARFIAGEMYDAGCSVILAAAGYSDTGVFQAAARHGKLAVGGDSGLGFQATAHVLTSLDKRMDMAVVMAARLLAEGRLENGEYSLGLAERGVGLTPVSRACDRIPPAILERVRVEADLLAGRGRPAPEWTPAMLAGPSTGLTERNMACH